MDTEIDESNGEADIRFDARSYSSRLNSMIRSDTESILGASQVYSYSFRVDSAIASPLGSFDFREHSAIRSQTASILGASPVHEGAAAEAESLLKRREVEEDVIQELMESESRLKVVSIIGREGLGKTTLARKIYNNNQVQLQFPCLAWFFVSIHYRPKEFLLSLLKCSMSSTSEELSEEELKKKVAEWLKGKKYLVVLDDIWKTQVWDEVKEAFPDDQTGSRILITSRNKEVAHYAGTASPYYLPILNEDESWELFTKKIFRGEECPSDLEPLGRSLVKKCRGLPRDIVALAGHVVECHTPFLTRF